MSERAVAPGQARSIVQALLLASLVVVAVAVWMPLPRKAAREVAQPLVALSLAAAALLPVLGRALGARLAPPPTLEPGALAAARLRAAVVEGALCEVAVMLAMVARLVSGSLWPLAGTPLPLLGLVALLVRLPSEAPDR